MSKMHQYCHHGISFSFKHNVIAAHSLMYFYSLMHYIISQLIYHSGY